MITEFSRPDNKAAGLWAWPFMLASVILHCWLSPVLLKVLITLLNPDPGTSPAGHQAFRILEGLEQQCLMLAESPVLASETLFQQTRSSIMEKALLLSR